MQWVDKHPVWWRFWWGTLPSHLYQRQRDNIHHHLWDLRIEGCKNINSHPFEVAYGPWLSYSRDWSLSPLACKIAKGKSSVLCQVNVSCPFPLLVKSSFAERSGQVLMVRAGWRKCREELGTSVDPELCTGRAGKGGGILQSSLK